MNQLSNEVRYIYFDVRPIFSVYEELIQFYRLPEPESIKGLYDVNVRRKIKDLEATYPMIEQGYPWGDMTGINEDELLVMSDYLGMRPLVTEPEIVHVLEYHHMMYLHNGEFRNIPVVGVW